METALVRAINNDIYAALGERWYSADDDPVALLRAESRLRNPWVSAHLRERVREGARVLDVGCGAGFLSNYLARQGFQVTGLDASKESLAVAARHDETGRVVYESGDALALPHADASFDAVCAMDFLEHVEDPASVIGECARVLRPGGLFFFHTFNRNPLAWLVVIKGVEWFVKNTPRDMHVLRLFIKPAELAHFCHERELDVVELRGSKPVIFAAAFWKMLGSGVVPPDFSFEFTRSTLLAYTGFAERRRGEAGLLSSAQSQADGHVAERSQREHQL
jgi:2-polyprenyl-6-hydroxyphenyl methylase / 3-demethylubiquinone-9 3-methyltransferase